MLDLCFDLCVGSCVVPVVLLYGFFLFTLILGGIQEFRLGLRVQGSRVFRVDPRANKLQIKQAIQEIFGKKVVRVNTAQYAGKKKRERRADFGRRPHWKKAIVTLAKGEKIDLV